MKEKEKNKEVDYRWSNETFSNIVSNSSGKISNPDLARLVKKLKKRLAENKNKSDS